MIGNAVRIYQGCKFRQAWAGWAMPPLTDHIFLTNDRIDQKIEVESILASKKWALHGINIPVYVLEIFRWNAWRKPTHYFFTEPGLKSPRYVHKRLVWGEGYDYRLSPAKISLLDQNDSKPQLFITGPMIERNVINRHCNSFPLSNPITSLPMLIFFSSII